ncbi:hypothetical protein [Flavobacterium seoulense]|uniref:Uncharacterized protein n=1 Tax=Flavobacterium seoulense TaxID=1492738 RepID=A0A066WV93_9FLAO|nr:hypothetical protein [Flavobacterium seoulense]KDN54600.1 hypothetical protein FEM21_23230 [Flavobacterium seoulense]
MKTLKLIAAGIIFIAVSATSQAQVSVNVNIGTPPAWGPAGYTNIDYYYIPDVQSYYDIRNSQFIYFGNGKWIRSRHLPHHYRNYDLYSGYKVVLNDYHGRTPYIYYKDHKAKYYKGYKGKPQQTIGYRNNDKHVVYKQKDKKDKHYDKHNSKHNNSHRGKGNDDKRR